MISLGIGLGITNGGGASYDPDAAALFARMAAAGEDPTGDRKALYNSLIVSLKAAGTFWSSCQAVYVMAAHGAASARLNWKGVSAYDLTGVNSPTFTTDRGYQSDGSSSYLDSGYNPLTVNAVFTQDSGHIGVWSRTDGQSLSGECGNTTSFAQARSTTDVAFHRINAASSSNIANTNGTGHYVSNRINSANTRFNRNGVLLHDTALVSTTMTSANFRFCGRSGTVQYSGRQQAVGHFGAGLTDAEILSAYDAFNTYLTAIGAG